MQRAGVQEEGITVAISEEQIYDDFICEDLNCIINSGEIPNLFDKMKIKIPQSMH